jgi:hypothetical protein
MDPIQSERADDPDHRADDYHARLGRALSVGEGVEHDGSGDRVDCVPAGCCDHGEDDDEDVSPVPEGVAPDELVPRETREEDAKHTKRSSFVDPSARRPQSMLAASCSQR